MQERKSFVFVATIVAGLTAASIPAKAQGSYTILLQPVTPGIHRFMAEKNLPPGAYWYNGQNADWGEINDPALSNPAKAQGSYTVFLQPAPPVVDRFLRERKLPPSAYWYNGHNAEWGLIGDPRPRGRFPVPSQHLAID